MSAASRYAQDAVLAWRRRGQTPPGVDPASAPAAFVAAPELEELILKACEATANDEREAFAPLVSAARGLAVAHRSGIGENLSGFEAREMAIEDVCSGLDGLDQARRDILAEVCARRETKEPTLPEALKGLLADERREEGELLARLLEGHTGIGSGQEAAAAIRGVYRSTFASEAATRARYGAPRVTELEVSDPRVQELGKGGEGR